MRAAVYSRTSVYATMLKRACALIWRIQVVYMEEEMSLLNVVVWCTVCGRFNIRFLLGLDSS